VLKLSRCGVGMRHVVVYCIKDQMLCLNCMLKIMLGEHQNVGTCQLAPRVLL
jgi:hypothetical protein